MSAKLTDAELQDCRLIRGEIVLINGAYFSVSEIKNGGIVVLRHLPSYKFIDWDKTGIDSRAEESINRYKKLPEVVAELELLREETRIQYEHEANKIIRE